VNLTQIRGFYKWEKVIYLQIMSEQLDEEKKDYKAARELLGFIEKSPSPFHVIKNLEDELLKASFVKLEEGKKWKLECGGKYFVARNSSSIISFALPPSKDFEGFMLTASHSDSPSFKIKENPCIKSEGKYIKLNVEKYGGMLCAPWFDRPLSVAGRIVCKAGEDGGKITLRQHLVNADKDLLMIPNLAIHMNRDANEGHKFNVQNELLPIFCGLGEEAAKGKDGDDSDPFLNEIASFAGVSQKDIVSADLFLYNREKGSFWGKDGEFIASPKIDDLECVWTSFRGFLEAVKDGPCTKNICVHCVFDNEEVGSLTRQGAASTFLYDTLQRINIALGKDASNYYRALAKSFMVSADNAHAAHPNYADKADPVNRPFVNGGPVIKFNAAQKYTSDAVSAAFFECVCKKAGVPFQVFTNRSDMAGGSTLGNISAANVSVTCVDIGLAQWAMHSPYESAGSMDVDYMIKATREFYLTSFELE